MKKKIGVLIIHGVGSHGEGYSTEFQNRLKNFGSFEFREILWADKLSERENQLWKTMQSARRQNEEQFPLGWKRTRKFFVHNIGDALAYSRGPNTSINGEAHAYDLIHDTVSEKIIELQKALDEDTPIVIFAHSLGATIVSDYIWDRQSEEKKH